MKKFLSVLLAVTMLLSVIPLTVISASALTDIQEVRIYLPEPVVMNSPSFNPDLIGDGYSLVVAGVPAGFYNGVKWYDYTGGGSLDSFSQFEEGRRYGVEMYLVADEGYQFNYSSPSTYPSVYINGREAIVAYDTNTKRLHVGYEFPELSISYVSAEVDIYNLDAPIAGRHPDYYPTTNTEGGEDDEYYIDTRTGSTDFINGVAWYDLNTQSVMNKNSVFVEGHTYQVSVVLGTNSGYFFCLDEQSENYKGFKLNHSKAGVASYHQQDADNMVEIWATYTCVTGEAKETISEIYITAPTLYAGQPAPFTATVETEGVDIYDIISPGNFDFYWYHGISYLHGTPIDLETILQAGEDYAFCIQLELEDGYQLELDSQNRPVVDIYINGILADDGPFYGKDHTKYVGARLDMTATETQFVSGAVGVYDIDAPVAGRTPDYYASYTKVGGEFPEYGINKQDSDYIKNGVYWYDLTAETYLAEDTPFIAGHSYRVFVSVIPAEGFTFCTNKSSPDYFGFYLNHEEAQVYDHYNGAPGCELLLSKDFTCKAGIPVQTVSEIYLTTPTLVGGQTAPFTATVLTEGVVVTDIIDPGVYDFYWYHGISYVANGSGPVNTATILEAGKEYRFGIQLELLDGYQFELNEYDRPVVDIYINGTLVNGMALNRCDPTKHVGGLLSMTAQQKTSGGFIGRLPFPKPLPANRIPHLSITDTFGITKSVDFTPKNNDRTEFEVNIDNLPNGEYKAVVSMENYVDREYSFTVSNGNVVQTQMQICPLGDVDLNGVVNIRDVNTLYNHVMETHLITDEYALKCANVNKDQTVNIRDVNKLYNHVMETELLY